MFYWILAFVILLIFILFNKNRACISAYGSPYPWTGEVRGRIFLLIPIKFRFRVEFIDGKHILTLFGESKSKQYDIKKLRQREKTNKVKIKQIVDIEKFKLTLRIGIREQPHITALLYGSLNGIASMIVAMIDKNKYEVTIYPHFENNKICFSLYCIIKFKVADIIFAIIKNKIGSAENGKASNRMSDVVNS